MASQGGAQPPALGLHVRRDTDSTPSRITLEEPAAWNGPPECGSVQEHDQILGANAVLEQTLTSERHVS